MFGKEPTVVTGAVSEILRQLIPMLIIFGFIHWTAEQTAAAFAFSSAVLSAVTILTTRAQVVSTEQANKQIAVALNADPSTSVKEIVEAAK